MSEPTLESKYRAEIACETELITKRLTWTLTFQGLMFAAFGVVKTADNPAPDILRQICILGLVAALSSLISTIAALERIRQLKADWETDETLANKKPAPFSDCLIHYLGHNSSIVIPGTAVVWWLAAMGRS